MKYPSYESLIRETPSILQKNSLVSNAAIVVFTSSAAVVLPLLPRQPSDGGGIDIYSWFVVCLMFSFAFAFTSMVLLLKKPKAARLLNMGASLWLASAFTLLSYTIIRNYAYPINKGLNSFGQQAIYPDSVHSTPASTCE